MKSLFTNLKSENLCSFLRSVGLVEELNKQGLLEGRIEILQLTRFSLHNLRCVKYDV